MLYPSANTLELFLNDETTLNQPVDAPICFGEE